jgi:hypothetical protein
LIRPPNLRQLRQAAYVTFWMRGSSPRMTRKEQSPHPEEPAPAGVSKDEEAARLPSFFLAPLFPGAEIV